MNTEQFLLKDHRRLPQASERSDLEDYFIEERPISSRVALTPDVTRADLTKYPQDQLENRLLHYEREFTFERDPHLRYELKGEVERTKIELKRRQMYAREEAERVFAL